MKINSDTDQLLQELHAGDPAERMYALAALAMSDEGLVDDELVRGLSDADRDCRATAARMLGEREAQRGAPALVAALLDSASDIAQEAAEALGKLGDPRAVEPLLTVLCEHAAPARAAAARALGALGDARAATGLAAALNDTTEAVRAEAAEALGDLASQAAIPALVGALGDPSDRVRQSAVAALRRVGPGAVDALLAELGSREVGRRWLAAWALGECAAPVAVEALVRALGDDSENVRAQAALALGSIGARQATGALQTATSDPSTAVCEAAALSLARLGQPTPQAEPGGEGAMRMDRDRGGVGGVQNSGHVRLREGRRPQPSSQRRPWDLTLLLITAAVLLLIGALLLSMVLKGCEPAPPAVIPPEGTSDEKTSPPEGKAEAPAPSRADCQVTRSAWYGEGDSFVVRGQVVNSGTGDARNVAVRVTVRGPQGEIIARRERPTSPRDIAVGHSGDFSVSIPLPRSVAKPHVEAEAKWD